MTITRNFERFQCFNFETNFLINENCFQKIRSIVFYLKLLRLKTRYFHTKLPCQKHMLRQIEWKEQNGPITKNRVLRVITLFFENFVSV